MYTLVLFCWSSVPWCLGQGGSNEVAIAIHHVSGLSQQSSQGEVPQLILFKPHTHFHLKITNTAADPLTLWKPHCPQGDTALRIQFRSKAAPDKVLESSTQRRYTAGMGLPKTLELGSGDDLIIDVDFLSWDWSMPMALRAGEVRAMEMRVVYHSRAYAGEVSDYTKQLPPVWVGRVSSSWEPVRIINRTGKEFGPYPPYVRSVELVAEDLQKNYVYIYTAGPKDGAQPVGVNASEVSGLEDRIPIYLGNTLHPVIAKRATAYNRAMIEAVRKKKD